MIVIWPSSVRIVFHREHRISAVLPCSRRLLPGLARRTRKKPSERNPGVLANDVWARWADLSAHQSHSRQRTPAHSKGVVTASTHNRVCSALLLRWISR